VKHYILRGRDRKMFLLWGFPRSAYYVGSLLMLSILRLYTVDDRMISECRAVAEATIGMGNKILGENLSPTFPFLGILISMPFLQSSGILSSVQIFLITPLALGLRKTMENFD
jgi:hypothetical protein